MPGLEIICTACGADTLVRREPVYEGFKKAGEQILCASCGHAYASEEDVPYKQDSRPTIFTDADRPKDPQVFREDEKQVTCRYCRHYVLNPFAQRCDLHNRFIEATDTCPDFTTAKKQE